MARTWPTLVLLSALAVALVIGSAPAVADFAAGRAAYEQGDFRTAREQWQAPAEAGDATAQAALGSLYIHGEGVPIDYREALKWTQLAAEQDDVTGQFNMGSLHAGGLGVDFSDSAAAGSISPPNNMTPRAASTWPIHGPWRGGRYPGGLHVQHRRGHRRHAGNWPA